MDKNNKKLSTNNLPDIIHKCRDWPELAEEHNWDNYENEYFNDRMFYNIIEGSKNYNGDPFNTDYKSSINFFNTLTIPENRSVYLTKRPGCLICHSDYIENKVHYAMIKGLCDLKTIQYYLFSKGIFFKAWYLKQHLEHISVLENNEIEVSKKINIIEILDKQINDIQRQIDDENKLGTSGNGNKIGSLRKQLKEYLDLRSQFKQEGDKNYSRELNFDDLIKKIRK